MSGGKVNIPSYIQDPSYRYKMPKMVLKQESRLNGVKTNIFNLDEVAKALRVPEEAIIKFWCAELGASKEKTTILKGQHNYETLLKTLDKFIEKYLLCQKCKYPETSMYVSKQKKLMAKCRACGNENQLDSMHRAGTHLMKQVPKDMSEIDKPKKENEDAKKEEEAQAAANGGAEESKDGKKSKKSKVVEEEPVEEQEADTGIKLDSEEVEEAMAKIRQISTERRGEPNLNEVLLEELQKLGATMGFSGEYRYWVLICGLFGAEPDRNIIKLWKSHEKAFLDLVKQDGTRGGKQLLQAIVLFFVRKHPAEMMKYAATFMKQLYDQEVFDEEFIIQWFNRKVKLDKSCALYDRKAEKLFKKEIEAFVTWLQNALEDEDEEEEGEEEEEEGEAYEDTKKADDENKTSNSAKRAAEESEAVRRQKELIQMQMQAQQQLIQNAKDEAANKAAAEKEQAAAEGKVNVLDIKVDDNFDIDDI